MSIKKKCNKSTDITTSIVKKIVGKQHTLPRYEVYHLGYRMKEYQPKEEEEND